MNNLFKKINSRWYYLGMSDDLSQYDIEHQCRNFYVNLSQYDSKNHHIVLSKDVHAKYVIEQLPFDEKIQKILKLYAAKRGLVQLLIADFNSSKTITIKNGKTIVIRHDTPERDFLLNVIEQVNNIQDVSLGAYIYTQKNANMGFRILPEIAKYIFKNMFVSSLSNGTKVNSRIHNKAIIFENAKYKIEKANDINELNIINWSFINKDGIIIDINKKADEILADESTSAEAKNAINLLKDENGEIHLIKPISELE